MTEKMALTTVSRFLSDYGYLPKRIDPSKQDGSKVPDFEVYQDDKLNFYCELKSPDLLPNPATHMFHWSTTISKIRQHISKAYKQFLSVDKNHQIPWVIFFTSSNFQLNWTNMFDALRGSVVRGQLLKDLSNQRFIQATDDEVQAIDVFIWGQVNDKDEKIHQLVFFINANSHLKQMSEDIVDNLTPYEDESIVDLNIRKFSRKR